MGFRSPTGARGKCSTGHPVRRTSWRARRRSSTTKILMHPVAWRDNGLAGGRVQDGQRVHTQAAAASVEIRDLVFRWKGNTEFSLAIDRFAIERGERIFLHGLSGSGKSTL